MNYPTSTLVATAVNTANRPQRRDYQEDAYRAIKQSWAMGNDNVLVVLPTGAGKTVLLSGIVHDHDGGSCVIAHRQELVSQISIALARNGVRHRIIGPDNVIRNIVALHMFEIGVSFYDPNATTAVAGVDTLVRRMGTGEDGDNYYYRDKEKQLWYYPERVNGKWYERIPVDKLPVGEAAKRTKPADVDDQIAKWAPGVSLWVNDEAHHLLKSNKWGRAISLFKDALGLGVTATPERSDGAGLGRHHDGVFDDMIVGPNMRELIDRGYLTDYDIVIPPTTIDLGDGDISKTTGDYKRDAMVNAVENSSLVGDDDKGGRKVIGDIVRCYQKFAMGKLGVTFVPSVAIGVKVKQQFIDEGIPAELVTADTPDIERAQILRRFKNREIMNLINVDLFGEGFDLPAIEVVSMARPTQSYGLYVQQFGRALRLMDGKLRALIIDHVGNVLGPHGHGLPDKARVWTLDRRDKKSQSTNDAELLSRCINIECWKPYERYMLTCPHCGTPKPQPVDRGEPAFVDGDLYMLDPAVLAQLRGEVDRVDMDVNKAAQEYHAELIANHCPQKYIIGHVQKHAAKHTARQEAQTIMRESFACWAGYQRADGLGDDEIFRKFYINFGVDYMNAMKYEPDAAMTLASKLMGGV